MDDRSIPNSREQYSKLCTMLFLGKHLSEHCRMEYPASVNYCLWALAEVAVIAADIPEGSDSTYTLKRTMGHELSVAR